MLMMLIVRVFPKESLKDSWDRAVNNLEKMSNDNCTPLYISQQEEKAFLSIIFDVKDPDAFADILVRNMSSATNSKKTRTITLLKPVFFPAPKDRPEQLERYQVGLQIAPAELNNVFSHTIHLDYPSDLFPTYAAYSFGEDDILVSMLSVSRDRARAFVKEKIESQEGVLGADVARISMSKRLAPLETWRRYREEKYLFKPYDGFEDYDFTERARLSGAFASELD
jgi:hypothetical protein